MFTPTTFAIVVIVVAFFLMCTITAVSSHVRDARRARLRQPKFPNNCTCDGFGLSQGGPHDPECPTHGRDAQSRS